MGLLDEYLPVARLYMVSLVGTLVINSITWLSQRKKVIEDLWPMRYLPGDAALS